MLSDFAKLILIFIISIAFTTIVLVFFHYWRKYRNDKLQLGQFSSDYIDEDISNQLDPNTDKQAYLELSKLKRPKASGLYNINSKYILFNIENN